LHIALDGIEVFNFSLREVVPNINKLLAFSGQELANVDYILFHQANRLINESLRKMLKIPKEKVPYSLNKFGNTSSASIPLTIVSELRNIVLENDLLLLLSAFGIGLSWATATIEFHRIYCSELLEL
jgi:3-oxoacyl-[acyl-carrier-protein] synthase-3